MSGFQPYIPLPKFDTEAYGERRINKADTNTQHAKKLGVWYRNYSEESVVTAADGHKISITRTMVLESRTGADAKDYTPYSTSVHIDAEAYKITWDKYRNSETLRITDATGYGPEMVILGGKPYFFPIDNEMTGELQNVSREAFIQNISGILGGNLQEWTTQLSKLVPKETVDHGHMAAEPPQDLLSQHSRIDITTDGSCSILHAPQKDAAGLLFRNGVQLATDAPPATGRFEPDTLHGTHNANPSVIASVVNDPDLKSSLPNTVRAQLAEAVRSGAIVRIDHVGDGDTTPACSAAGVKPVSQETPRRR